MFISFSIKYVNTVKLTYEWYANVTAGSLMPTEHLSNYKIVANLIIYSNDEHYKFQVRILINTSYIKKSTKNNATRYFC